MKLRNAAVIMEEGTKTFLKLPNGSLSTLSTHMFYVLHLNAVSIGYSFMGLHAITTCYRDVDLLG